MILGISSTSFIIGFPSNITRSQIKIINCIKELRTLGHDLGLKEAKDIIERLIDYPGTTFNFRVNDQFDRTEVKERLKNAGLTVL